MVASDVPTWPTLCAVAMLANGSSMSDGLCPLEGVELATVLKNPESTGIKPKPPRECHIRATRKFIAT